MHQLTEVTDHGEITEGLFLEGEPVEKFFILESRNLDYQCLIFVSQAWIYRYPIKELKEILPPYRIYEKESLLKRGDYIFDYVGSFRTTVSESLLGFEEDYIHHVRSWEQVKNLRDFQESVKEVASLSLDLATKIYKAILKSHPELATELWQNIKTEKGE